MPPRANTAESLPPEEPNALVQFLDTMTPEESAVLDELGELDERYGNAPTPPAEP